MHDLFSFCVSVDSTKALQDQVLAVDGPKSDHLESIEVKRLKDEMTSLKKKVMGKSLIGGIVTNLDP